MTEAPVRKQTKKPSLFEIICYITLGCMSFFGGIGMLSFEAYRSIGVTQEYMESRFDALKEEAGLPNMKMVVTDGDDNCGGDGGGCFHTDKLDTIFVSPTVKQYYLDYVIVHEIGHSVDARAGKKSNECSADQYAKDFGVWAVALSPYKCDLK